MLGNNMLENRMVLPFSDDDPIDEPQEREYDKHLDSVPEDYADLHATLFSIGFLQTQIGRIDKLVEELQGSSWARRQAGEK